MVTLKYFFKACLSYAPFKVWTDLEGGQVKALCMGMKNFMLSSKRVDLVDKLKEGFLKFRRRKQHYGTSYLCLQLVNLPLLLFQSWYWIRLFGKDSDKYGIQFLQYYLEAQSYASGLPLPKPHPSSNFFPLRIKCQMNTYGVGGDIEVIDLKS